MKKIFCIIIILVLTTSCVTLMQSPKDQSLLRDFDEVTFSADDIKTMEERGLDPEHLTAQQKIEIVRDWKSLQAALLY